MDSKFDENGLVFVKTAGQTSKKTLNIASYKNHQSQKVLKMVYPSVFSTIKPIGFLENRFFPDGLISSIAYPCDAHGKYADSKPVQFLVRIR
jgi:hypothetical protein